VTIPREVRCPVGVKSAPADHVIYTAEDLQKADGIAAAPRTGSQCHYELTSTSYAVETLLRVPITVTHEF
jgi:hypothetical protein